MCVCGGGGEVRGNERERGGRGKRKKVWRRKRREKRRVRETV